MYISTYQLGTRASCPSWLLYNTETSQQDSIFTRKKRADIHLLISCYELMSNIDCFVHRFQVFICNYCLYHERNLRHFIHQVSWVLG